MVLGQAQLAQTGILEFNNEGRIILEPEGILDTKEKVLRYKTIKEYLIKWKNIPKEFSSWESEAIIHTSQTHKAHKEPMKPQAVIHGGFHQTKSPMWCQRRFPHGHL
jgi:hypothetical protein